MKWQIIVRLETFWRQEDLGFFFCDIGQTLQQPYPRGPPPAHHDAPDCTLHHSATQRLTSGLALPPHTGMDTQRWIISLLSSGTVRPDTIAAAYGWRRELERLL